MLCWLGMERKLNLESMINVSGGTLLGTFIGYSVGTFTHLINRYYGLELGDPTMFETLGVSTGIGVITGYIFTEIYN
jgi:cation transporter-like permease